MSLEDLTQEELSRLSEIIGDDDRLRRLQRGIGCEFERRASDARFNDSRSKIRLAQLQKEQRRIDREIDQLIDKM